MANEILMDAFNQLKEHRILSRVSYGLWPYLLKYARNFALRQLRRNRVNAAPDYPAKETKILYLLLTQCNTLKEVATILNISKETAKKKLHLEFSELRNQNCKRANLQQKVYLKKV
jgi:DNA-binding CsgD family transcriptional regulator